MSSRLFRSTLVVSVLTTLSRVLGYVRDVLYAVLIGASAGVGADAFLVAFKIPNFMRRLFAEGAFAQAFVPVISEYRVKYGQGDVRALVAAVSGMLGGVLAVVTVVGVVAAPVLVALFAPGFIHQEEKYDLAVELLRITFPYLLFISLTALAGGVLNTYGRFAVPAFTPVLLNLAIIAMAVWVAPHTAQPVYALAWGVFFGGIAQLLLQLPFLARLGLLTRPRLEPGHPGLRRIVTLMIPALFGVSVGQINLLLDTLLASFLVNGSVSWLYYADRLVEFPLGIFGISLGVVILPALSRAYSRGSRDVVSHNLDWALRWVVIIGFPSTLGLMLLAEPILITLFNYGAFTMVDVRMAGLALVAYAIGLVGFILVKVLAPGFFARQDTRTPVRIAIIAMVANMVMNLMLIFTLAHVGLALATALAAWINGGLLYGMLRRDGTYRPGAGWPLFGARVALGVAVMGLMLWLGVPGVDDWAAMDVFARAGHLGLWVTAALAVYGATLWASGLRFRELVRPVAGA
ncbi:MAG: murein biosynthesis integral membrane protein MurJ [Gammaproteobacteria bacterium]|nr:murein biosynthesis integral membrane protein MurJ [Gammaproteobacteria bacterium]